MQHVTHSFVASSTGSRIGDIHSPRSTSDSQNTSRRTLFLLEPAPNSASPRCMLFAPGRLGASLKLFNIKGSPWSFRQLPQTHLPLALRTKAGLKAVGQQSYSFLASPRPCHVSTMFKQALRDHSASVTTSPPIAANKQSSLGNAFNRTLTTQKSAARPLANGLRQHGVGAPHKPPGSVTHGVKRTSGGLAKSLSSHDDMVHYPSLDIVGLEKENGLPPTYYASSGSGSASLASALFDENDFDSDIDLDVEDPATKGTVTYPNLPSFGSHGSQKFERSSKPQAAQVKAELDSSQPIPWSSSPIEHFKTPRKPALPKAKRSTLPWTQNQTARATQETMDEIESDQEQSRPKKRKSATVEQALSTPAPKSSASPFLWNTTASALKQQQKAFREQSKVQSKTSKGVDDDVKEAIQKKKKNTVHRIFLSEEQQNVLNLVTEYKKSVFFTGSAGETRLRYSRS